MPDRTLANGTTISTRTRLHDSIVTLSRPRPQDGIITTDAGRVVLIDGVPGFQPSAFLPGAISASTLRALADLLDDANEATQ